MAQSSNPGLLMPSDERPLPREMQSPVRLLERQAAGDAEIRQRPHCLGQARAPSRLPRWRSGSPDSCTIRSRMFVAFRVGVPSRLEATALATTNAARMMLGMGGAGPLPPSGAARAR
jgi:hypothetical protein